MGKKRFSVFSYFVGLFILAFVVNIVVSFVYNFVVHKANFVDWGTSLRWAIILAIILTWVRFKG